MNYQASFQALYTAHTRACSWHVLRVRAIALPGRGLAPHLAGASAIPRRAIDGSYEATKATGQELIDRKNGIYTSGLRLAMTMTLTKRGVSAPTDRKAQACALTIMCSASRRVQASRKRRMAPACGSHRVRAKRNAGGGSWGHWRGVGREPEWRPSAFMIEFSARLSESFSERRVH